MKKITALLMVFLAVTMFVGAEDVQSARFIVDGRPLTEMPIEELYDLEDSLVSALEIVFFESSQKQSTGEVRGLYVVNAKTKKFHYPWCYSALQIGENRQFMQNVTPSELIGRGYAPCGQCNPFVGK